MGMNVLVTGGAGAIGSNLVRELLRKSLVLNVIVLDDLSSGYLENIPTDPRVYWIQGDVADSGTLDRVFSHSIDVIFHLAAHFANQNSVEFPEKDLQTNGLGTLKLLQMAHRHKIKRFIYTSSSCVYGAQPGVLEETTCALSLDTPYAMTKLLGEQYADFFYVYHGLPTVILRLFNTYGPGERPGKYRNVIPNFYYQAMRGQPLQITGTGQETRDFNFMEDTIKGILLATWAEGVEGKVVNIASGAETTLLEIAERINQLTSNSAGIVFIDRRKWDKVVRRKASIRLARELLGYEPSVSFSEGLARTYEWLKTVGMKEFAS